MPCSTNWFSILERCTIGLTNDMLHPIITLDWTENPQAMPENPLPTPTAQMHSLAHAYVHSADTHRCTRIPLKIHSVDTGHPSVDSLLDSGATGMFIDAEFVRAEKLRTRPLPHAIPVYNIDGTPNELDSIKEEVNLIYTYGDHTEHATFLVTSLGSLSIIL